MFIVNNKDERTTPMTSFWCLYFWLKTCFTPSLSVSIVNFKHVIAVIRFNNPLKPGVHLNVIHT